MKRILRVDGESGAGAFAPEWLVANGLGGFASGTLNGQPSRRYHGLLIASLPAPLGRYVVLDNVGQRIGALDGHPDDDEELAAHLRQFELVDGRPVWRYATPFGPLTRTVFMVHGQNTTYVVYGSEGQHPCTLALTPIIKIRPLSAPVDAIHDGYRITIQGERCEIQSGDRSPALSIRCTGYAVFTIVPRSHRPSSSLNARRIGVTRRRASSGTR